MDEPTCSIDDCNDRPAKRGWCNAHYLKWYRHGDPLWVAEVKPRPACAVETCDTPARFQGWCRPHYRRWKATGDVQADVPIVKQVRHAPGLLCAAEGCEEGRHTREWCLTHYKRWRKTGDPLKVAFIRGDNRARLESYVDRSGGPDACHPWTGAQNTDGYGWMKIGRTQKGAHLVAWELENGPMRPGEELDHECHNEALRNGTCEPGICTHRLCCNLRHLIPRTRDEHAAATPRPPGSRRPSSRKAA